MAGGADLLIGAGDIDSSVNGGKISLLQVSDGFIMKNQDQPTFLKPLLVLIAIALFSVSMAACSAFSDLKKRASLLAGSLTGMKCLIASVGPCLPCGIKASDVTICSASGTPLFQAKELRAQINPFRYLLKDVTQKDLLQTIHGDQIKLTLTRNESGEWDFPRLSALPGINGSAPEGKAVHRRIVLTNVTIAINTGRGVTERFYNKLEAEVAPTLNSVTLKISGTDESAKITLTKGAVKQYELQGKNFSLAILASISAIPLPFKDLVMDGTIRATTDDGRHFAVEANGAVGIQSLSSRLVSSRTVEGLSLPFDLKGDLSSSGIENLVARISLAGETAIVRGEIRRWDRPQINLMATFADFSYDRAISAVPRSLRPSMPVVRLSGSMTGTFSMRLDLADPASLDYRYSGRTDRLEILDLGQSIDIHRLKGPFLHKVRMNPKNETTILLSPDNPDFIPYRKIPFSLRSAVMAAEDLGFFSHRGFSKANVRESLIENLKAARVVRGASTISMQLAKNLFLSPERTLSRKLEEALITVALEQNLDKKRIMEIYLNIIEWGDGIYGIGPAARYYFGKNPSQLSAMESAFLASIIARPKNWRPDPLSKLGPGGRENLRVILCRMYRMGAVDIEDLINAGVSQEKVDRLMEEKYGTGEVDTPVDPPQITPPDPTQQDLA